MELCSISNEARLMTAAGHRTQLKAFIPRTRKYDLDVCYILLDVSYILLDIP